MTYTTLEQYLGPNDSHLLGPLMCCLALFVWVLTVSKELTAVVRISRAVYLAPAAPTTRLEAGDDGKTFAFRALGFARKFCCLAVFLVRLGIDVWLLWFGIQYLVRRHRLRARRVARARNASSSCASHRTAIARAGVHEFRVRPATERGRA